MTQAWHTIKETFSTEISRKDKVQLINDGINGRVEQLADGLRTLTGFPAHAGDYITIGFQIADFIEKQEPCDDDEEDDDKYMQP